MAGERRGEFRYVFLADPSRLAGAVPGFVDLLSARQAAETDGALDAFLTVNPQYRGWVVAALEVGSYDEVRTGTDGKGEAFSGPGRRRSIARWWLAADGPGVTTGVTPAPSRTVVELERWSARGPGSARVQVRSYATGTWAFHLESIELTVDVVCRPGGARWPATSSRDVLIWPGRRIPDRFFRQVEAGETSRDCTTQLSAVGLSPLAVALREAPFVAGAVLGARLVEGGSWRRGTYITE